MKILQSVDMSILTDSQVNHIIDDAWFSGHSVKVITDKGNNILQIYDKEMEIK